MSGKEKDMVAEGRIDRHMWLTVGGSVLPRRLRKSIVRCGDKHLHEASPDPATTYTNPGSGVCGELREFHSRDH